MMSNGARLCADGRCRSPIACDAWGHCRVLHERSQGWANAHACWDLAIAELRRAAVAECRGAPLSPYEIGAALHRAWLRASNAGRCA